MRTAILISGHTRTFGVPSVFAAQKWWVFRQCPNPTFFCSVVNDAQAKDLDALHQHYPGEVHIERIPSQPDCAAAMCATLKCNDADLLAMTRHAPYVLAPHASPQTVLRALWHQSRTYEFAKEVCAKTGRDFGEYTLFVRHRPDLFWHKLEMPEVIARDDVCVPYWGAYSGINDRFAIMGDAAAPAYFGTARRVADLLRQGCPLHPETLSGEALKAAGVQVRPTLIAEFTGVRLPDAMGNCETVPMVVTQQDHFRHRDALTRGL